jgi:hypothetical protein
MGHPRPARTRPLATIMDGRVDTNRKPRSQREPMQQVGMAEIQKIFEITDPMGIHRESVMIPLGPRNPGSVKRKPNGKFEIVVDASMDFDTWLLGLADALRAAGV